MNEAVETWHLLPIDADRATYIVSREVEWRAARGIAILVMSRRNEGTIRAAWLHL